MQNERYEEWNNTLRLLRKLFNEYPERVLRYHQNQWPKWKFPAARISTASQGNFLETLNMSLNRKLTHNQCACICIYMHICMHSHAHTTCICIYVCIGKYTHAVKAFAGTFAYLTVTCRSIEFCTIVNNVNHM